MRTRSILLVVAILLVAGFAALNWAEIVRPSPLLFGPVVMDAPLGAILMGLLAITLILFLASSVAMRTQSLIDYRHQQKTLEQQRALAEKAEASRYEDLRTRLDEHLRNIGERDTIAATEYDKSMLQTRRELQAQIEQMGRMLSARLNEMEHRLENRFERAGMPGRAVSPVMNEPVARDPATGEPVTRSDLAQEHAMAREARAEERAENRELREVQREERAADRPAESGWRRWF